MFDRVQVRALAGPLKVIQRLVTKSDEARQEQAENVAEEVQHQTPDLEDAATKRSTWRQLCQRGVQR